MKQSQKDSLISIFLSVFAVIWLLPLLWTLWNSFRPYKEILQNGIFSFPSTFSFDNYRAALAKMSITKYFFNTVIILTPSVFFILFFSSLSAFVLTKYTIPYRRAILVLFTAGSLLPAQVIYYPIFKMYLMIGDLFGNRTMLYDNYLGIILVHIAMQTGFATFVLHSQLLNIPKDFSEAAQIDGANVFQHYFSVILPMIKAPLASLGILLTTLIYNDFVVAWSLLKSDKFFPITTSLTRVGAFNRVIPDQNVLAAGALIVAIPLVLFFLSVKRYFSGGVLFGGAIK